MSTLSIFLAMEKKNIESQNPSMQLEDENEQQAVVLTQLPKVKNWDGLYLYKHQAFWCPSRCINGMISFQNHFQAKDGDIMLTSFPKSGTTWLKSLIFAIVNRSREQKTTTRPNLLTNTPHQLVPFLELDLYLKNQSPDLENIPTPRIFATHAPYASLPRSIINSNCRIVYICRNPFDQFISNWHFYIGLARDLSSAPMSIDEAFDMFCQGFQDFGPFWEHILGFWNAALEEPDKILFLKYEDLKEDITIYVKKLADFIGFSFSKEEEDQGVVEQLCNLCSIDNMKSLQVNKTGNIPAGARNNTFFRKGEVGDWTNYLSPTMTERLEKLMEEKWGGYGLNFKKTMVKVN